MRWEEMVQMIVQHADRAADLGESAHEDVYEYKHTHT
jgi:hypothetical protein